MVGSEQMNHFQLNPEIMYFLDQKRFNIIFDYNFLYLKKRNYISRMTLLITNQKLLNHYQSIKSIIMENNQIKSNNFIEENKEEIGNVVDDLVPFLLLMKREKGPESTYLYARNAVDGIKKKANFDDNTSCTGKCSFCCHSNILVSHDEGIHIRTIVKQRNIIPNSERLKKQKKSESIHYKDLSWSDKACSLLSDPDENGDRQCTIYDERPIICRTHNSTEDPINCDRSEDDEKPVHEIKIVFLDALLTASIVSGGKPNSREPKLYSLHEFL